MVPGVTGSARLLGAERDEHHRQARRLCSRQPGELEQHRHTACVVLGPRRLRNGVQMRPHEHVRLARTESGW